ncbi:MAG TPA: inorganic diphosphatase [Thermomicrobiales bacterium]|jgi:inorganic pyrophosphatase
MTTAVREVEAFIEIPRGSQHKYEYDPKARTFRLKRVLYSAVHYPADYGFIPETLAPDGDPLDIMVLLQEPTFPGCLVPCRPIGSLGLRDQKGTDAKILAVPTGDPRYDRIRDLGDVDPHWLREIETFFATYKLLDTVAADVQGWHRCRHAQRLIAECRERYQKRPT